MRRLGLASRVRVRVRVKGRVRFRVRVSVKRFRLRVQFSLKRRMISTLQLAKGQEKDRPQVPFLPQQYA
jgi:hypothetical protein